MATAILSSRNTLNHRFDHEPLIHRNSNPRRHSNAAPRRLKRSPTATQSKTLVASPAANTNLVMGQVKILKRGETLSSFLNSCAYEDDKKRHRLKITDVASTMKKQIRAFKKSEIVSADYAGSCNSVSPPPTSLPIPCFLENKKN
ncbi:hypothetical protein HID58_084139 [Brassica napus]|uniref:Uncharacterized protein n=1 Tax=Brassica napus TaxID=3708 RepID=A0ABQ7XIU4_BRANA|nr:uncharacterized protein LOC106435591 [Brassica napus]KAH0855878.1 hypothetical protein HID58_084139 [Brassica napus]